MKQLEVRGERKESVDQARRDETRRQWTDMASVSVQKDI